MSGVPHEMTVRALRETLALLPDDAIVAPNRVENLWVGTPDGEMLGYIDFAVFTVRGIDSTEDRMHWSAAEIEEDP